jgi:hypothetical protein
LQINNGMTQFDIFADVLTQRSEHETGVWIAGLDAFASEALTLADHFYFSPPVVCYVDRGHGAAIRRVKTQLPGGGINPIAIIRIPRERLVGSGIAASLVHEVGHQGSVLLRLVESLHPVLQGMARRKPNRQDPWILWDRWISEILSDLWAVAKLGITATVGLMSVMSLPRAFVFRLDAGDPHPLPWIRVVLSCALGHKLYPHPQWGALCDAWESCYPLEGVDREDQQAIRDLLSTMPGLVDVIVDHKPASLRGKSIGGVLRMRERTPAHLMKIHDAWNLHPESMSKAPPTLAFAVLGQARVQGRISAEDESQTLASLLNVWALTTSLTNPRMQNNLTVGRRRIQC